VQGYNEELFRAASKTEKRQDADFFLFLPSAAGARMAEANVRLNSFRYNPCTLPHRKTNIRLNCRLRNPFTVPIEKRPPTNRRLNYRMQNPFNSTIKNNLC